MSSPAAARAASITCQTAGQSSWMASDPVLVDVLVPAPAVFELGAGGERVGGRVEVSALVERRIGRDQMDGVGVDASEEGEVVAVEEGPVGHVQI